MMAFQKCDNSQEYMSWNMWASQAELRMLEEFTLQLCDSLRLSSGWLNPDHLLPLSSGLTHRDLLNNPLRYAKKKNPDKIRCLLQNQSGVKVTRR